MWGIIKKLLYGVAVAVGMIVDWTLKAWQFSKI
ncbi:hypothetical protein C4L39_03790 [Clostridium diolis]|nr:hypothetical protein C4L39_03790 [Clostridium diolis]